MLGAENRRRDYDKLRSYFRLAGAGGPQLEGAVPLDDLLLPWRKHGPRVDKRRAHPKFTQ